MARRRGKSAKERKEERKQEERRSQQLIIAAVVAVAVVFGGIIFALNSVPAEVVLPTELDRYDRFMTSTTAEGYPILGNPDAPVTVREYSSFSCPGCAQFHDTTFPQLLPLIAEGAIQFVFVPLQTGSIPNADGAARTALCAGEQGRFWDMHDTLFLWHETYASSAFQDSRLRAGVSELGLSSSEFNQCFRSNRTDSTLAAALAEGVGTTPSIEVNGVVLPNTAFETIQEAVNNAIPANTTLVPGVTLEEPDTGSDAPAEATEAASEATEAVEATEEMPSEEAESEAAEESTEEADAETDTEATEEADS